MSLEYLPAALADQVHAALIHQIRKIARAHVRFPDFKAIDQLPVFLHISAQPEDRQRIAIPHCRGRFCPKPEPGCIIVAKVMVRKRPSGKILFVLFGGTKQAPFGAGALAICFILQA